MIYKVLKALSDGLNADLNPPGVQYPVDVVIDNISKDDNDATAISNKLVITLLSTEEEAALKNTSRYEPIYPVGSSVPQGYKKKNPAAYLNLYVMITANRDSYEIALENISKAIESLNTRKTFIDEQQGFQVRLQLHPLPFDQLSYVWGLLGGKVIPSALYKVSVVKIQKSGTTLPELIKEIDILRKEKKI
ncbi:DUF4255 domain-containing protein [Flavobacterium cerinum]|uniref:DUF4255 domain-containing protein n=1 Tax=Flavobacterium cerinum TaxID=2502784 RepID=A0ABY5IUL7_9FLAO|nr:DUF4255 domain-containing protein [Flavobacterium cerinum]UUC46515.1 DUF4255 domain-containing protein [Flavobacterium cerinum]